MHFDIFLHLRLIRRRNSIGGIDGTFDCFVLLVFKVAYSSRLFHNLPIDRNFKALENCSDAAIAKGSKEAIKTLEKIIRKSK